MPHRTRVFVIAVAITLAVAGCADATPSSPATAPLAVVPTMIPSAPPTDRPSAPPDLGRPDPGPDAPAIAEPYWLGVGSPGSSTITDANGTVTRQLRETSYQVIDGGRVEDDIIVNGRIVGSVSWTVVEIDDGGDPMMEQVEALKGEAEEATIDGIAVYYHRFPDSSYFAAHWWEPGGDRYMTVVVSEAADLEPLTEALIAH